MRPQKLTKKIEISQKGQQMKKQTVRFRYRPVWKRLNTSKKTKSVSQKKRRKSKYSCRTGPVATKRVCR